MEKINRIKKKVYLAAAHDAGGAEVLSSYIIKKKIECYFVLGGPATKIFKKKFNKIKIENFKNIMHKVTHIICSSSYNSDLEYNILNKAIKKKLFTTVIMDHWHSYKERLTRNNITLSPNEILTLDTKARKIATKIFPKINIRQVKNYYYEEIIKQIYYLEKNKSSLSNKNILVLCEPTQRQATKVYKDKNYYGYTERSAINFFIKNIKYLNFSYNKIIFRRHPAEPKNKYSWVLKVNKKFMISKRKNLLEDIANAEIVVGFDSMGLVIALMARKRCISCIPPGGKNRTIPHKEILNLRDLVANN